MRETLACEITPRVDAVSPAEWQRLFPDLPDSLAMVQLMRHVGVDGVRFHSLVVRDEERPIVLLPLFETVCDLSFAIAPAMRPMLAAAARAFPQLTHPRLLGVGVGEAYGGRVGVDPLADSATIAGAWDLALDALDALAQGLEAELIAFVHVTAQSGRLLPRKRLAGFREIAGPPVAQVPITYAHVDEYLASLSEPVRSRLQRQLRKADGVKILRTRQPGPWLDAMHRFHVEDCRRGQMPHKPRARDFFALVCQWIKDAEYTLYFLGERLAAFQLQIIRPERLIEHAFGIDPALGLDDGLKAISWMTSIDACIAKRIPLYQAGHTEVDATAGLGVQLIPSRTFFRHRQPLVQWSVAELAPQTGQMMQWQ